MSGNKFAVGITAAKKVKLGNPDVLLPMEPMEALELAEYLVEHAAPLAGLAALSDFLLSIAAELAVTVDQAQAKAAQAKARESAPLSLVK